MALSLFAVVEIAEQASDIAEVSRQSELATSADGPTGLFVALQNERNWAVTDLFGQGGIVDVPVAGYAETRADTDKALDGFEAAKEREAAELRARNEARPAEIQEEIDAFLKKKNAEIEALKKESAGAPEAFAALRARKQAQEQRLFEVVGHFVEGTDTPITTGPARPAGEAPRARPHPRGGRDAGNKPPNRPGISLSH